MADRGAPSAHYLRGKALAEWHERIAEICFARYRLEHRLDNWRSNSGRRLEAIIGSQPVVIGLDTDPALTARWQT